MNQFGKINEFLNMLSDETGVLNESKHSKIK